MYIAYFFVPTSPHFTSIDFVVVACPERVLVLCDLSFNELFPLRKNYKSNGKPQIHINAYTYM